MVAHSNNTVSLSIGNWFALIALCLTILGAIVAQSAQLIRVITVVERMDVELSKYDVRITRIEGDLYQPRDKK